MAVVTPAEAAVALALAAAFDGRDATSEAAARAWAEVLADVTLEDASAAILAHYGTERKWVMPADVREHVSTVRRARLTAAPLPVPTTDPDDAAAYAAEVRRIRDDIASDGVRLTKELEA